MNGRKTKFIIIIFVGTMFIGLFSNVDPYDSIGIIIGILLAFYGIFGFVVSLLPCMANADEVGNVPPVQKPVSETNAEDGMDDPNEGFYF